jgi:hypothetical protein
MRRFDPVSKHATICEINAVSDTREVRTVKQPMRRFVSLLAALRQFERCRKVVNPA